MQQGYRGPQLIAGVVGYANTIGAARRATVWTDPRFRPGDNAVYYVRVLEIPTARWTTLRATEHWLPLPKDVPATIQQRAWSSPIWYAPAGWARA